MEISATKKSRHFLVDPEMTIRKAIILLITAFHWHAVSICELAGATVRESEQQPNSLVIDGRIDDQSKISIDQLITQLGDANYIVRDEAETQLLKIGGPAIQPLRAATTYRGSGQPDSEIRLRATRLLILIERKERERKIREFLEGKQNELYLGGWSEFSRIVGSDRVSRKLFVDMHRAQPELLGHVKKKDRKSVEESYQLVCRRSLRSNAYTNATQTIGTLTAMLFVSTLEFVSDQEPKPSRISVGDFDLRQIQSVLTQTQMITFVNSSGTKTQVGKLISNWLRTLPDDENASIIVQLSVIDAYQLSNQLALVARIANKRQLPPPTRITAIDVFGNLANRNDVSEIEPLLDDRTFVGNYLPRARSTEFGGNDIRQPSFDPNRRKLMHVQIRDLALATSIKLSKLDLDKYGFDPKCFSGKKLIRNYAGFFSEEDRKTAFDKWAERNSFD